jgi:hypothetical protein
VSKKILSTEDDVMDALRKRYPADRYAFLPQVPDKTGQARRIADLIVMGLWKSRGLLLEGFEIKVRRSDLRKELDTPEKADRIGTYCDKWWLVLGDPSLLKETDNIPQNWGVILPQKDGKLRVHTSAAKLNPAPISRLFLASLMRQAQKNLSEEQQIRSAREKGYHEGFEAGQGQGWRRASQEKDRFKGKYEKLRKAVDDFEEASGVRIGQWEGERIGKAVRKVLHDDLGRYRAEMKQIQQRAAALDRQIKADLKAGIYGGEVSHDPSKPEES